MKMSDGTVISSAFRAQPLHMNHGTEHVKKSTDLKIGTIVSVRYVDSSEGLQKSADITSDGSEGTPYETVYDVRVDDHNARPFIYNGCRALKPFMGANNYFDMTHESADLSPTYIEQGLVGLFTAAAESLVGSRCIILCIEGQPTAPVIMGFLQHPARPSQITEDMGLHMEFEFNGINVSIDKDGAFTLIGNGPKVDAIAPPIGPVPDTGIYADPLIGPFAISLDSDMVFSVSDNTGQEFSIDRVAGTIDITNGTEEILITSSLAGQGTIEITVGGAISIDANSGEDTFTTTYDHSAAETSFSADTSFSIDTGNYDITAKGSYSADSASMKLTAKTTFEVEATTLSLKGKTGELLALINSLITAIGALTAASPTGPCAPLQAAPQWAQVMESLVKLQGMTG